jgi:hypothetical protein
LFPVTEFWNSVLTSVMIAAIALEDSVDPRTASSAERRCWDSAAADEMVEDDIRKPVDAMRDADVIV